MSTSVLDFIDPSLHAGIAARTSTTDVSGDIQEAINHVHDQGGGTLYFPAGAYHCAAVIQNKRFVSWRGDGPHGSALIWPLSHTTHGVRQANPLNAGTTVRLTVEGMAFGNCNSTGTTFNTASSAGGGWYDTASHQVRFLNCNFGGWKYGVILDQSEEIDFHDCVFSNNKNGLWIVNGQEAELSNTGASSGFSNRISVHGGAFSGTTNISLLDDGGEGRVYEGININTGVRAGRFAGVSNLRIADCYIEGVSASPLLFAATRHSVGDAGQCSAVEIEANVISPMGTSMIEIASLGSLTLQANRCPGELPILVTGVQNCASFFSRGNNTQRPIIDNRAVYVTHVDEYVLEKAATANVGAIGANATAFVNVPAPGFIIGDMVEAVTASVDLGDDIVLSARLDNPVHANGNCQVRIKNEGAATTLPNCSYRVLLRKRV